MLPGDSRESTPKEEVKVINESSLEMISCGHLQRMAKGTSLEEGGFHWAPHRTVILWVSKRKLK